MQHMRHRFDLLAKITQDEQQRDELSQDGTVDRSLVDEIETRLDQTRAELATYSSIHAEAIVAEEMAMVEATNGDCKKNGV